jgi:hemoglobin-like flavoprotein
MLAAEGQPEGEAHLRRLAVVHDRRHRDIRPELYDQWLTCLLQAVRECDPRYGPQVEQAWRAMLAPGISVMKAAY